MDQVSLVRWPDRRRPPRVPAAPRGPRGSLLVEPEVGAPAILDPLEDWVRLPADEAEVGARLATLAARAGADQAVPEVDADGLLRYRDRWVALSPVEQTLAARPHRAVRCRRRARHPVPAGLARRAAHPQRPRRPHLAVPAPHRAPRPRGPHRARPRLPPAERRGPRPRTESRPAAARRATLTACGSASTRGARSPISSPRTAGSSRCRRPRTTRPARCAPALDPARRPARPARARPRHDGGHQRACSSGAAAASRSVATAGFADVIEIAPPGPARRCTTRRRPPRAARAPRPATRGGRPPRRARRRARAARRGGACPTVPAERRRGRGVPAARRPRPRTTSRPWPARSRARGPRRDLLARGVARVPRVRAHRDHRRQRATCARRAAATSRELVGARRRGARHDLGRRAGARPGRRPSDPPRCCSPGRPAACAPRRRSRPRAASPTR